MTGTGETHGRSSARNTAGDDDGTTRHNSPSRAIPARAVPGFVPVAIGTALWAVALVVLVVLRDRLGGPAWVGAAVVGLVSGLLGLPYLRHRARRESTAS